MPCGRSQGGKPVAVLLSPWIPHAVRLWVGMEESLDDNDSICSSLESLETSSTSPYRPNCFPSIPTSVSESLDSIPTFLSDVTEDVEPLIPTVVERLNGSAPRAASKTYKMTTKTAKRKTDVVTSILPPKKRFRNCIPEGEFHDQADSKWIVIRGPLSLRGHNDTPCGSLRCVWLFRYCQLQ
jgi:hypothetical protein